MTSGTPKDVRNPDAETLHLRLMSLGIMGAYLRAILKPLNTIVL